MAVQILALQQRATANDATGNPLAGAKLYTYETGTTTPLTTYTTSALNVANQNPIVADAAGRFGPIYTDGSVAVKVVISTSADVTVDTLDPSPFTYDSQSGASQISHTPNALLTANNVQGALDQVTGFIQMAGASYATVGGTANAITLTTPFKFTGTIPNGTSITFIPPNANTGATTVNVDGLGAQNVLTVNGGTLPNGYIIANRPCEIIKSGATWFARRQVSRVTTGSGGGIFTLFEDSTMIGRHQATITSGGTITWTFNQPFTAAPIVTVSANTANDRGCTVSAISATSVDLNAFGTAGVPSNESVRAIAIGNWY